MRAAQLMTKDPTFVTEVTTVSEAIDLLYEHDIRHLPIVRGGEVVGIVSDRDLRRFQATESEDDGGEPFDAPRDPTVSTVMNTNPARIDSETDVAEIVELMLLHRVGALPVVDTETNRLLGIVSYVDLLRLLQGMLKS